MSLCLRRINPDFADTHYYMAGIYERLNLYDLAQEQFRHYLSKEPSGEYAQSCCEHIKYLASS